MQTLTIDVNELPTRLREVAALAAGGAEVILSQDGVPLAKLAPLPQGQARIAGLHAGAIQTAEDFDAPLPEEFWAGTP